MTLYIVSSSWPGVLTAPTPPLVPMSKLDVRPEVRSQWRQRIDGGGPMKVAPSGTPIAVIRAERECCYIIDGKPHCVEPAGVVAVGVLDEVRESRGVIDRGGIGAEPYNFVVVLRDVVDIDPPVTRYEVDDEGGHGFIAVGSLEGPWGVVPDGLDAAIKEAMT